MERDDRADPCDPKTAHHLPECQFASVSEEGRAPASLKVRPGMGPDYDWITCAGCDCGWQVAHFESVG